MNKPTLITNTSCWVILIWPWPLCDLDHNAISFQYVAWFLYDLNLYITLTNKVRFFNLALIVMFSFMNGLYSYIVLRQDNTSLADMWGEFDMNLTLNDLDQQGQIFQFCFNCRNFFIYWWIKLILEQNNTYDLTNMLDDFDMPFIDLDQ